MEEDAKGSASVYASTFKPLNLFFGGELKKSPQILFSFVKLNKPNF